MLAPDQEPTAEELRIIASIKATESETNPLVQRVIDYNAAGNDSAAMRVLLYEARPRFTRWLAQINEFIDLQALDSSPANSQPANGYRADRDSPHGQGTDEDRAKGRYTMSLRARRHCPIGSRAYR